MLLRSLAALSTVTHNGHLLPLMTVYMAFPSKSSTTSFLLSAITSQISTCTKPPFQAPLLGNPIDDIIPGIRSRPLIFHHSPPHPLSSNHTGSLSSSVKLSSRPSSVPLQVLFPPTGMPFPCSLSGSVLSSFRSQPKCQSLSDCHLLLASDRLQVSTPFLLSQQLVSLAWI